MQLHEQTQRLILLLIFYAFGPILTLGIIGGIVLRKLPANARHWERTLTQQTGLHWKIQSVEYCSPGFVRLHSVQILDDDAKHSLFESEKIDVRLLTDSRRNKIFPGIVTPANPTKTGLTAMLAETFTPLRTDDQFWQITVQESILNLGNYSSEESASLVQNMLRKVVSRFDSLADVPVVFVFDQIVVISEYSLKKEGDNTEDKIDILRSVLGNIYRTPTEIRSDWAFQIKDVSEFDWEHRERLSFALSSTDTLEVAFRSGGQPIPCDLAAVFCSLFKHFSGGSFQGEFALSARLGSNSQTIRLHQAIFKNLPLAPLVRSYTDFAIEGTVADLELTRAVFGTEGNFSADGNFLVQSGAMEKVLFHRCVDKFLLDVQPPDILDAPTNMVPFTQCAIHFQLQPSGIKFWADQKWGNAFMYQDAETIGSPLKMVIRFPHTNRERIVTYPEIMSIFAPNSAPVVPFTPGLQIVLPHIPTAR